MCARTDQCRHICHRQICPVGNLPPAIGAASGDTLNVAPVEVTEYPVVQLEPLWLADGALMARHLFDGVSMVSIGQIPRGIRILCSADAKVAVVLAPTFQGTGLLSVAMSSSTIRPMTGDSVEAEGSHEVVLELSTWH